jgi:hypothetical protein
MIIAPRYEKVRRAIQLNMRMAGIVILLYG